MVSCSVSLLRIKVLKRYYRKRALTTTSFNIGGKITSLFIYTKATEDSSLRLQATYKNDLVSFFGQ